LDRDDLLLDRLQPTSRRLIGALGVLDVLLAGRWVRARAGRVPSAPVEDDREIVERQLGRRPRAFLRVAARCPFGRPAVTEQLPYDESGEPFPTGYYLTCRALVAAIARLEAAGGVERWSRAAAQDPGLAESRDRADEEQRARRRELARGRIGRDGGASLELGVGGAGRSGSLKCLHAHAAFALANPGYELGEQIVAELDPLWPDHCCTEPAERG